MILKRCKITLEYAKHKTAVWVVNWFIRLLVYWFIGLESLGV